MRWILIIVALLGFLLAFLSHSPGMVALGVVAGLMCGVGAALVFIDLQIRSSSRSEYMTPGELDALKATLKTPSDRLPPPESR
ncbi:MAG: hypothetical protein JSS21_09685 [Proteobacteria bacterium]|nr:hypothetical protein [Pseudomonadota bacterium]